MVGYKMRNKRYILLFLGLIGCFIFVTILILIKDSYDFVLLGDRIKKYRNNRILRQIDNETQVLIYWTPFLNGLEHTRICDGTKCFITEDRRFRNQTNFKAFMFYGSSIDTGDFPLPRSQNDLWALYHEESPKNMPFLSFHNAISMFNLTATPSRFSDIPLTLQYLGDEGDFAERDGFMQSLDTKNSLQRDQGIAPVLYLNSICDTLSLRDQYIAQLMQHVKVDSYGKCLHNIDLPKSLTDDYLETLGSSRLYRFIAKYKFIIAYENAACDDYITEKLWRALKVGTIPIYFGASNIKKWLPNSYSAILVDDFSSPRALAEYIKRVNRDENLYWYHTQHKYDKEQPIKNSELLHRIYRQYFLSENHQSDFECYVCTFHKKNNLQKDIKNVALKIKTASQSHFNCSALKYPKGISIPKKHKLRNWFNYGKCEASALNSFMYRNTPFTKNDLNIKIREIMLSENGCDA